MCLWTWIGSITQLQHYTCLVVSILSSKLTGKKKKTWKWITSNSDIPFQSNVYKNVIPLLSLYRKMKKFIGRVDCFSMLVVMKKYFFLNPEKNLCRSVMTFSRETHSNSDKNDVTKPKARLLLL